MPKTNADFWRTKRLSNVERDRRNVAALNNDGWKVLEVWECQTKKTENLLLLKNNIRDFLGA